MRTAEQFAHVHTQALRFIKFHNKNVWIVPHSDGYNLSILRPEAYELPVGTQAIEVGLPVDADNNYTIYSEISSIK